MRWRIRGVVRSSSAFIGHFPIRHLYYVAWRTLPNTVQQMATMRAHWCLMMPYFTHEKLLKSI